MAAPALLTHELSDGASGRPANRLEQLLTSEGVARLLALFAGGEMLADKAPFMPNRTDPAPLVGRAVLGSLTAAAYAAHRRRPVALPAAIGGVAAVASTYGAFHLRRWAGEHLDVPDRVLGLIEDAVVVAASRAVGGEIEEDW